MQLLCPICGQPLAAAGKTYLCPNRHSFDIARQGYVHLLPVQSKHSASPGDTREQVLSRRAFLETGTYAPIASWELLTEAVKACEEHKATYHVGNVNSSDVFYGDHEGVPEGLGSVYALKKMGVMALEMEAAALYMNAARYGKRALCICTISDHVLKGVETTSQERQTAFTQMMKIALDVAVAMENK